MKKILLCSFVIACDPTLPYTDPTAPPDPLPAEDSEWCKSGCEHLAKLTGPDNKPGCFESRPLELPDGSSVSCTQFCQETQNNGRSINPKCWITISKCNDLEPYCRQ